MNFDQLITSLRELDTSLKGQVIRTANVGLTLRNWLVGAYIVEFEQNGEERAEYGDKLMPALAERLNIAGLNLSNLKSAKAFALAYPQKSQTLSGFFPEALGDSVRESVVYKEQVEGNADEQNRKLAQESIIGEIVRKQRRKDMSLYKNYAEDPDFRKSEESIIRILALHDKSKPA